MVTNDSRNNIISLAVIAGFAILISSFIFTFVANMEKATDEVSNKVDRGIDNVTTATAFLTNEIHNLTGVVNKQLVLQEQEREASERNLAIFLSAFRNQSIDLVNTINELNKDSNASREYQMKVFVDTLGKSQNLTRYSQNLSEQRLAIENQTAEKLDSLARYFNLTLTPNATVVETPGPRFHESFLKPI